MNNLRKANAVADLLDFFVVCVDHLMFKDGLHLADTQHLVEFLEFDNCIHVLNNGDYAFTHLEFNANKELYVVHTETLPSITHPLEVAIKFCSQNLDIAAEEQDEALNFLLEGMED